MKKKTDNRIFIMFSRSRVVSGGVTTRRFTQFDNPIPCTLFFRIYRPNAKNKHQFLYFSSVNFSIHSLVLPQKAKQKNMKRFLNVFGEN
jgi:hypothetical protein